MSDWKNKVAVITGASSGIGAGLVEHCVALGMQVVAAATNREKLETLREKSIAGSQSVEIVQTDVSDPAAVESLAQMTFDLFGKVNLLFNNAGILIDGKSWQRPYEDWKRSFEVNVLGVVNGIRSFVPRMLQQGEAGRVVNTSSVGGLAGGTSFMGPYVSTKHAVIALTETLYNELREERAPVPASVLCPGEVVSDIYTRPCGGSLDLTPRSVPEQAMRELVAARVADGMTPGEYARLVFQQLEADKFWILTHHDFKPMLHARVEAIFNETNPLSFEEILQRTNAKYGGGAADFVKVLS